MPHQCVKCGRLIEEASDEILKGCSGCGGKFFFYIKKEALPKIQEQTKNLTHEERIEIEEEIREIIGPEIEEDKPIILDLASINVLQPGKFELDLVKLFKGAPVIYKLEEGKYIIDVASTFQMGKRKIKEED